MVKPKRQRQGKVLQRWRRHKVEKETKGANCTERVKDIGNPEKPSRGRGRLPGRG